MPSLIDPNSNKDGQNSRFLLKKREKKSDVKYNDNQKRLSDSLKNVTLDCKFIRDFDETLTSDLIEKTLKDDGPLSDLEQLRLNDIKMKLWKMRDMKKKYDGEIRKFVQERKAKTFGRVN